MDLHNSDPIGTAKSPCRLEADRSAAFLCIFMGLFRQILCLPYYYFTNLTDFFVFDIFSVILSFSSYNREIGLY